MTLKTALIWNPAAGRATPGRLENVMEVLGDKGHGPELFKTEAAGDGGKLSRKALDDGFGRVVACGGDGTVNEVIQPLVHTDVKVGIIPLGTVNVLAKELGIPRSIRKAAERAASGKERRISLGKAALGRSGIDRYFFLMAGVGFDAEVISSNSGALKKKIGRLSYLYTGSRMLFSSQPGALRFIIDGDEIPGFHAVIGKSSRYGGNLKVTKAANLFEPELHAVVLKNDDPLDIVKLSWYSVLGSTPCFAGAEFRITRRVAVEGRAKIQLDGELVGETPCVIESAENCLTVIC